MLLAQSVQNSRFPQRRSAVHLYKILILFHCPLDGERFIIAVCGFVAMLLINIFSLKISSIALMLVAGAVSLGLFLAKGAPEAKGGGTK